MQHLADLLAAIPLPEDPEEVLDHPNGDGVRPACRCDPALIHDLGADLPAGHLHVWGGPSGAGKTAFLLNLLYGAAGQGRRVVYATYDLAPETLALRLLAMAAGVHVDALPDPSGSPSSGSLTDEEAACAIAARAALAQLPFSILAARGFSTRSLWDRIVRMPYRAEVMAVDYLQGVVREPGTDPGVALRALSDLADHLHVAVICAVRAADDARESRSAPTAPPSFVGEGVSCTDRVGWISPAADAGSGEHCAEVLSNRHGERSAVHLHLDRASGGLRRAKT